MATKCTSSFTTSTFILSVMISRSDLDGLYSTASSHTSQGILLQEVIPGQGSQTGGSLREKET